MAASELHAVLDTIRQERVDGYLRKPFPHSPDQPIDKFLDLYREADDAARTDVRAALRREDGRTLGAYAERMATLAARERSPELLSRGLLAVMLDGNSPGEDLRDVLVSIAPLQRTAERLEVDAEAEFDRAAALAGPDTPRALADFPRRPPAHRSLAAFNFIERDDDHGLLYEYVAHPELLRLPADVREILESMAGNGQTGYLRQPFPSAVDHEIASLLDRLAGDDFEVKDLHRALRLSQAQRLEVFAERMASQTVHTRSQEALLRGVTAALLASLNAAEERRAVQGVLAILADAADRAGLDFDAAFVRAKELIGIDVQPDLQAFLGASPAERDVEGFGYERRDGDAELLYERTW